MADDPADLPMTEPARPADDAPLPNLWPAELDADYELIGELGRGGMAVVFRARDRDLGREVAIKVVKPRFAADEEAVARLAREARTVAQLEHPNIVGVYSIRHLADRSVALVMQLVPGRTLKQAVVQDGPFAPDAAEAVLRDIARALAYAHRAGVVHRDVKPENIFLDAVSGRAMLSDFGVARVMDAPTELTATGTTIGTPTYMAPEQIDGVQLDGRSDLYSLGMVGWEMLTGERPWSGESLYSVIYRQKHDQLTPIDAFRDDVPLRLQYLIEGLMPKNPDRRWASASRFLSLMSSDQPLPGFKEWESAQRRRRRSRVFQQTRERGGSVLEAALETVKFARPPTPVAPLAATGARAPTPVAPPAVEAGEPAPGTAAAIALNRPTPARGPAMRQAPGRRQAGPTPSGGFSIQRPPHRANTPYAYGTPAVEAPGMARWLRATFAAALLAAAGWMAWVQFRPGAEAPAAVVRAPEVPTDRAAVDVPVLTPADSLARAAADSTVAAAPAAGVTAPPDAGFRRIPPAADSARLAVPAPPAATRTAPAVDSAAGRGSPPNLAGEAGAVPVPAPTLAPPPLPFPRETGNVAAGGNHSCALSADGRAACWGSNDEGQLGDGSFEMRATPGSVEGDFVFSQVSTGLKHTCGVTTAYEIVCWGANGAGELGDGTTRSRTAPVRLNSTASFRLVRAGREHTCALSSTRSVFCWGSNASGQLGDGTRTTRSSPVAVSLPGAAAALAVGWNHTCAITSDGAAWCWGSNEYGQLGDGTTTTRLSPTRVRLEEAAVSVAAGASHSCAVAANGQAFCWGRSNAGQLGSGTFSDATTPRPVSAQVPFAAVTAGSVHSCAVGRDGSSWCWGRNTYGQLGDGTTTDRSVPVQVRVISRVTSLDAGAAHTCASTGARDSYCWGYNVSGQVGRGDRDNSPSPFKVVLPPR